MRILVGILYTIENEFEDCIKAIEEQTHKNFEYFVIQNLPNKLAHDTLYNRFMNSADTFDLFMKIDADMVLSRTVFFEQMADYFTKNPNTDHYATYVHDFYTNRLIGALHTFRNTVKWQTSSDTIFVDRYQINKKSITDKDQLAPAAFHCPKPSKFQSFHFGLHKAVKAIQFQEAEKKYGPACEHWQNYELTKKHYQKTANPMLAYAVLGAEVAFREKFSSDEVNFDNKKMKDTFSKYEQLTLSQVKAEIKRFSIRGWSFFPPKLRHDVLFRAQSKKVFTLVHLPLFGYILKMLYYHSKMRILQVIK